MIEVKGAIKSYHAGDREVRAVDAVDITVNKGDFAMIVGRSGSGKSTLLGMMGGLIRPTSGEITLDGKRVWGLDDGQLARLRGERIGFVFQFSGLLGTLTSLENVMLPSMFAGERKEVERRAKELLSKLGLSDKADSFPSQLSGGEMKRVAIARALVNDPDVILADEPTGDLDSITEIEILDILKEVNRKGKTIVMVTHNPELSSYATSLYRMDRGKLSRLEKKGGC